MTRKLLLNERKRYILLLLFYKNDPEDIQFFIKSISNINDELKYRNFNKNEQFEFFLKKAIESPTKENLNRLRDKFIEIERKD